MIFLFQLSEVPKYIILDWAIVRLCYQSQKSTVDIILFMSVNTNKKCYKNAIYTGHPLGIWFCLLPD